MDAFLQRGLHKGRRERETLTSFSVLATLLMKPTIPLAFQAVSTQCWLMLSFSSARIARSFSVGLLSRNSSPIVYIYIYRVWKENVPRGRNIVSWSGHDRMQQGRLELTWNEICLGRSLTTRASLSISIAKGRTENIGPLLNALGALVIQDTDKAELLTFFFLIQSSLLRQPSGNPIPWR